MANYIEIVDKIYDVLCNCEEGDEKGVLEYIAQELQNEGIGWNEGMPDGSEGTHILCVYKKKVYCTTQPFNNSWLISEPGYIGELLTSEVTHWQPLPALPKEKND